MNTIKKYPMLIISALLILSVYPQSGIHAQDLPYTIDDDTKLEFHWSPASGNVDSYNIFLATYSQFGDEKNYILVGKTQGIPAPTAENPYAVPVVAEDGKKYELKVQAESPTGITGPFSEPSIPVWCKLRSPGHINGKIPGDADGNLEVNMDDMQICISAWGSNRDEESFDYRADLNYDDSVDILDLVIIGRHMKIQ